MNRILVSPIPAMLRKAGLSLAILVCLIATAKATPTIVLGNYVMPVQAGNVIQVFVSGGDAVQGVNFIMDINNNTAGGGIITGMDILTGTIFAGNNVGQFGVPLPPATKVKQSTVTSSGTVAANGLLGTITISTVGVAPGVYPLRMTGMATAGGGSTTNFTVIAAHITNGTVTVTPEPSTLALAAFGFIGLAAWGWRKRMGKRTI